MNLKFNAECYYYGIWYWGLNGFNGEQATLLTVGWQNMDDPDMAHVKTELDFKHDSTIQPRYENHDIRLEDCSDEVDEYRQVGLKAHRAMKEKEMSRVVRNVIFKDNLKLLCWGGEIPDRVESEGGKWWLDDERLEGLIDDGG